ncbi:MAG: TIR domain-containing protein, partial [Methanoregula sp.]|uniref:toll/interleukin-1 receptor domain-containing protein n=1 Tax=Methanoregula sp. TaxID=2052170 RepID=UPI003C3D22B3
MNNISIEFDVALSFANEDRLYVGKVADYLHKMGIKVFYDKYEEVTLWGKDLYEHLIDVYKNKSRYTVIFASKPYSEKIWTTHERRAAQARALESHREYILPVRIDDTEIPGILNSTGYIRSKNYSPRKLAELIKKKVGPIPRENFFPEEPDLLYRYFKANSSKNQDEIYEISERF